MFDYYKKLTNYFTNLANDLAYLANPFSDSKSDSKHLVVC
jgi:hypothetical protein